MSGVAKDDTNPSAPAEDTVSAVGDAEAGHAESAETAADAEPRNSRRAAPHLRVVADNDEDFVAPTAAEQPNQRIGHLIRATRENLGYTLDQVSKETRVHLSHLRAIEDMTPNMLGAPVYAKGYIKTYARHLGLDEQTTLQRYLKECAILKDPEKQTIAPPATGRKLPVALPVFGFLIVALVVGAGVVLFANGDRTPGSEVAEGAPSVVAGAPSTSIGVIANPTSAVPAQQLRVVAIKRELIEIRSAAGDKYVHRTFEPGESYNVRINAGWTVSTGDGSAFEWRLGDQSLGLLAPEGPVYSQSVDLAAQRPPIVVELPLEPAVTTDPASTDAFGLTEAPSTGAAPPPRANDAAPAPSKPRTTRPKPEASTPAKPPATQPQVAATPSSQPASQSVTPQQDPALLAYPGLPAQPVQ